MHVNKYAKDAFNDDILWEVIEQLAQPRLVKP